MSIEENTKQLINSLPSDVVLVGVTKYSNREEIEKAINSGLTNIGENRVDSIEKIKGLNVKKHFIGNIQSNKIRLIVENFNLIHSVSSLKHLIKIDNEAKQQNKIQELLLQLKISSDENKIGIELNTYEVFHTSVHRRQISSNELDNILQEVNKLKNIKLQGFMMMASNTTNQDKVKEEFKLARQLFDKYKKEYNLRYLSMGMSKDYNLAIEEGSNMVRVGSKIFK